MVEPGMTKEALLAWFEDFVGGYDWVGTGSVAAGREEERSAAPFLDAIRIILSAPTPAVTDEQVEAMAELIAWHEKEAADALGCKRRARGGHAIWQRQADHHARAAETLRAALSALQAPGETRVMLDENGHPLSLGEAAVAHEYLTARGVPWKGLSLMGRIAVALQAPAEGGGAPIDMVLFCPKCGMQHIDEADPYDMTYVEGGPGAWTNPPHRSHLCHGCGYIWRPADVPTNGVAAIKTKGKNDSPALPPAEASREGWRPSEEALIAGAQAMDASPCMDPLGAFEDGVKAMIAASPPLPTGEG